MEKTINKGIKINGKDLTEYDGHILFLQHKFFGHAFPYKRQIADMFSSSGLVIGDYSLHVIGNPNNVYLKVKKVDSKGKISIFVYSPIEFKRKFWERNIRFNGKVKEWLNKLYDKYITLEKASGSYEQPIGKREIVKRIEGLNAIYCSRKRHYVIVKDICHGCINFVKTEKVYDMKAHDFKVFLHCRR